MGEIHREVPTPGLPTEGRGGAPAGRPYLGKPSPHCSPRPSPVSLIKEKGRGTGQWGSELTGWAGDVVNRIC